jgi:hypothetical protein
MGLSTNDLKDITEYIDLARSLKPVAGEIVDLAKDYGPEIYRLFESIVDGYCALRVRAINNFINAGFSEEIAVKLAIATTNNLTEAFNKIETEKKGK